MWSENLCFSCSVKPPISHSFTHFQTLQDWQPLQSNFLATLATSYPSSPNSTRATIHSNMESLKAWNIFFTLLMTLAVVDFANSYSPTIERSSSNVLAIPTPQPHPRQHKSITQGLGQKPLTILANDTSYEQLMCIGFNPSLNLLSATIEIKLPDGFGGSLCTNGSTEYVRFWVSYDDITWIGIGYVTANTHDIANTFDCRRNSTKPLFYTLSTQFEPIQSLCMWPTLPKIRATLSWNDLPPDDPTWSPVWGNTIEDHIQSPPKTGVSPDVYTTGIDALPDCNTCVKTQVALDNGVVSWPKSAGRLIKDGWSLLSLQMGLTKRAAQAEIEASTSALAHVNEQNVRNTAWEEVTCLGLDWVSNSLIATVKIKQPSGYGSGSCENERFEYVSFWADFNNTCKWTFLGVSRFWVHDYGTAFPSGGLSYTAVLPVDVRNFSSPCNQTKIARVRAALAYNAIPPTPPEVAVRGNILDAHVHLQPYTKPNNPLQPDITYIGNVDVVNLDASTGMTLRGVDVPVAFSAGTADPWLVGNGLARECPFGGNIVIRGDPVLGYSYRVMARPYLSPTDTSEGVAANGPIDYNDPTAPLGINKVYPNSNGWFEYVQPSQNYGNTIANWAPAHDGLWEVRVELGDSSFNTLSLYSAWYNVTVNNLQPTAQTVHIALSNTGGSVCGFWTVGTNVTGTFDVASSSPYFGVYTFALAPAPGFDTNPIVLPYAKDLDYPTSPVTPGNSEAIWSLRTNGSVSCGYVVTLTGYDRTIVGSSTAYRFNYPAQIGFCLRDNAASQIGKVEL